MSKNVIMGQILNHCQIKPSLPIHKNACFGQSDPSTDHFNPLDLHKIKKQTFVFNKEIFPSQNINDLLQFVYIPLFFNAANFHMVRLCIFKCNYLDTIENQRDFYNLWIKC